MKFTTLALAGSVFAVLTAPLVAQLATGSPEQMLEGKKQYMLICVACHQPTGMGLPPVFPPIAKQDYVTGSSERLAAMILKGNAGPITVDGKLYNNIMPGQEAVLTDDRIAAVMTYVRANFGNVAPPVGPEVVAAARLKFAARKTPWTETELKAWGGDAAAPAPASTPTPEATPPAAPASPVTAVPPAQP